MDDRFLAAEAAIRFGDAGALEAILVASPELATERSSCSHPTLMQCLVLDGVHHSPLAQETMAKSLLDRGSPIDEPLIAAASVDNVVLGRLLLDHGAARDGSPTVSQGWTPLEESLYWDSSAMTKLLLDRGAKILNLRTAAGLGRVELMSEFFDGDGGLRPNCGGLNSPFGALAAGDEADLAQNVLDNALCYAAMGGHEAAARLLIRRGAAVDSFPLGFDYRGTALHWAALRGHRPMCDLLLAHGASPELEDLKVHITPAGWALHGGHDDLARHLGEQCR